MGISKLWSVGLALVVMLVSNVSTASGLSAVEVLDRAAEQRTLVLSVAKHYVLAAANVEVKASQDAQGAAIKQFSHNLGVLKFNAPNAQIRTTLRKISQDWSEYLALLEKEPTNQSVEAVIEATNQLVFQADLIISNWKGLSTDRELEAMNLAHHQAMLSERISMLYAAHYFGLKSDWVVMELNETLQAYEESLSFLNRFTSQDREVTNRIDQVNNQWAYAKQGFAKFNEGQYVPKLIAVTMGGMQEKMSSVANHYSQSYSSTVTSYRSLSIPGLAVNIDQ